MSGLDRLLDEDDLVRHAQDRKTRRPRGVQPTFAERQESWRGQTERIEDALIPDNDSDAYRPEYG